MKGIEVAGILLVVRTLFVITIASVSYQLTTIIFNRPPFDFINVFAIVLGAFLAITLIWIEIKYAARFLVGIFTVILGLFIGFIASNLFLQAMFLIPHIRILKEQITPEKYIQMEDVIRVGVTFLFCYLAIAILFNTKNRFKLLIPFIDFTKEGSERFLILDSNVIIDGRIGGICDTNILRGTLVVPQFVLNEIQILSDSSDKQKRLRGRRGLEVLANLQETSSLKVQIDADIFPKIIDVDGKLVALAKKLEGIIVTNDYSLKKIAQLHEVEVINLNALANAVRASVFPGEYIRLKVVKAGEEVEQGIGYLDDGTVVVIESGRKFIDKTITIVVTNVLQNNIGRMVFAKITD